MAEMSRLLARIGREPFANLPIADLVLQQLDDAGQLWRERLLPPLVTLRLFVTQILNGNCAITALRQASGIDFAASSYCEARERLSLRLLQCLLVWMQQHIESVLGTAEQATGTPKMLIGRRVLIADGSTYSMKDTPALRSHFHLPAGVKEGVGYPMGKIMGLLDAATGLFVNLLALPLFEHDMRSVVAVHPALRPGDILLGDRALCSFAHIALLNARGVYCCFRLHQRRKNFSPGLQKWKKQLPRPAWMTAEQFRLLPVSLDVRLVRHSVEQKGFRTRQIFIVTTLLDLQEWPDARIAELYAERWRIETCFNHLKTTMKMNVLKCESVDGVMKELAVYLVVYNLVRMAMLQAAKAQGVSVMRISFVDAMRRLLSQLLGLPGVSRLIVNPDRSGRVQLRVIRRRTKQYDLLTMPRREMEKKMAAKAAKVA